jgi:membrane-associated phospholipid phosphatase
VFLGGTPEATATLTPREVMPRPTIGAFILNTGSVLTRPLRLEESDAWVLLPAAAGVGVMWLIDVPVQREVRGWYDPRVFDRRFSFYPSLLGEGWVDMAILGLFGIIGGPRGERTCIAGLTALAAVGIMSRVLKMAIRLERPEYDMAEHHLFTPRVFAADAMPSGHAMAAFATAAVLAKEYPSIAPLVYALAAYVGLTRLQQNVHWGSDVVAGAALGLLIGWEADKVTRKLQIGPMVTENGAGVAITAETF